MSGKLVLIIGPSGSGKSVILKKLKEKRTEWHFPRSATTRPRREGEGDDLYRFVTDEEFDALIEEGKVLEWAAVHKGARYGTLSEEIIPHIEKGETVIREVDVQGFESIRSHKHFRKPSAPYLLTSIFILPENKEQLIERIKNRAPISDEELTHRIASMEKELLYAQECDATVTNKQGRLKDAVREVEEVIR